MKFVWTFSMVCVIYLFCPPRSHAFSLSDHTLITERAVEEYNKCLPHAFSEDEVNVLVDSNLWEDLNLFNKWISYSHYYRPAETLEFLWRSDSASRVENLSDLLSLKAIGGIIHYLQDAASPPHVVPVTHGLDDGFESYALSDLNLLKTLSDGSQDLECRELLHLKEAPVPFQAVLLETGLGTLRTLSELKIRGSSEQQGDHVFVGSNFWKESPIDLGSGNRPFGKYGDLGNGFGNLSLVWNDEVYQVPLSEYDRIKASQLRLGIEATKKALSIWLSKR